MEKASNRSKWDIIFEALNFLSEANSVRTKLEMHIGLAQRDSATYLALLKNSSCIEMTTGQHGSQTYTMCNITKKGRELKNAIQSVYDLFGGEKPAW